MLTNMACEEQPEESGTREEQKFCVLISGEAELEEQMQLFKEACEINDIVPRKRKKHRYYQLGLMAKMTPDTTDIEMRSLLVHGTRTFHVDALVYKPSELQELVTRLNRKIGDYQLENTKIRVVTGLAVEITGDACRIGRMRNNCPAIIAPDDIITLTYDERYRYSSYKEIAYVINLRYYFSDLKVGDTIVIGEKLQGTIIKKLPNNIDVLMQDGGIINSYDYIVLPAQCSIDPVNFPHFFENDIQMAETLGAHYIVIQKIRCKKFLCALVTRLQDTQFKLIGAIDLNYVSSRMLDIMGIIKLLDYLWIPDIFELEFSLHNFIYEDVIPLAKCLKKPIIVSVPLERCSDFHRFENHEFLFKADSIYIEKSRWCHKYPLIVKKLLPVVNFRATKFEGNWGIREMLTSYHSITNFVIRAINSIETKMIILSTTCISAAYAFARSEVYCAVYVPIPIEPEEEPEALQKKIEFARQMNLRRNIRPILYTSDLNLCHYKPVEFMMSYLRELGCIETGDFVITVESVQRDDQEDCVGSTGDLVFLRAFYLPPLKACEKFLYA